jgi:hypothetical protein
MKRVVKAWRVHYGASRVTWGEYRSKRQACAVAESIGIALGWKSGVSPVYAKTKPRRSRRAKEVKRG